jgi:AraC-like DNA-binding protein
VSRRIVLVERGVLRIEQRIRIETCEIGTDVSGPACIYAHVTVMRGGLTYITGDAEVSAPVTFALFLPPFTIVQAVLRECDVASTAFAFRPSGEVPFDGPLLFAAPDQKPPASIGDVESRLLQHRGAIAVGRSSGAQTIARNVKDVIDRSYRTPLGFDRIASRLGASRAQVSRNFKKEFGLPPVRYRHQVRIMDALMQFAGGAAPADVFLGVGFADLSRFYKVFRRIACAAPGAYRPAKNAKTL